MLQTYTFDETCCDKVYTIPLRCSYRIFSSGIYPMNRCDGRGALVLSFVFYYTFHIHNIFVIPFSPYSTQIHFYAILCILTRLYYSSIDVLFWTSSSILLFLWQKYNAVSNSCILLSNSFILFSNSSTLITSTASPPL